MCARRLLSGRILYVGMFDGHGGAASSFFLKNNMLKFTDDVGIKMCSRAVKGDVSHESIADETNPLSLAFERADSALLDHLGSLGDPECWSGSTATVCFVSKRYILVANVGDSRAVLGRNNRAIQLSSDHRPIGSSKSGRNEIFELSRAAVGYHRCVFAASWGSPEPLVTTNSRAEGKNYSKSLRQLVYAVKVT